MFVDERRKSIREDTNLAINCWLMDRHHNPVMVDCIPGICVNRSSGGMELQWPASWKCKGCPYLEKNFNDNICAADACPFDNTSRFLVAAALLKILVGEEKTEHFANVVWVKEKEDCCRVGVSFAS